MVDSPVAFRPICERIQRRTLDENEITSQMTLLRRGLPYCKRCGRELDGGEESCPHCGFNPRSMGLRVSMVLLLIVVVSMTVATFAASLWVVIVPPLLGLAAIAFVLSVLTFLAAFVVTPYRLGSIFSRF